MKRWVDANEIAKAAILDEELYKSDNLMKNKPNFDKSTGARKVYQRKEYAIYQVRNGYVVHNTKMKFEKGHTHVHNYYKAKSIVDLAVRKKKPNRPVKWEIECLTRIANDVRYIEKLKELVK